MYHDQGLPVLKPGFGDSVGITLGLPIIRTSVDHGTALPLAGTGTPLKALQAINEAITCCRHRVYNNIQYAIQCGSILSNHALSNAL